MHHYIHDFYMRDCAPNLYDNLMGQFIAGKEHRNKKTFEFENTTSRTSDVKCCDHCWEKRKLRIQANHIYQSGERGHLPTNFSTDIEFTDEPVVQCDVPVAKKYVFRWLQINDKNDK